MDYAVMIQERYARYLPTQWITHSTETDANKAYWEANSLRAQGYEARVVEHHSQEWEQLVR